MPPELRSIFCHASRGHLGLAIAALLVLLTGCDSRSTPPLPASPSSPANPSLICPTGLPGVPGDNVDRKIALPVFKPRTGDFLIQMPHAPQFARPETLPTAYGPLSFQKFTTEFDGVYYEVGFGDVPGTGPILRTDWLNYSSNARLQGSALMERHDITVDGIPGKAYTAKGKGFYWSERIFFVERRFYRITVYLPSSHCTWPPDAAAFLNSFHSTHNH